jgi:TRAP-type C4-dicarboxylate transport system substrate-binding protein
VRLGRPHDWRTVHVDREVIMLWLSFRRRVGAVAVCAVAAAGLLVGCGDSDDAGSSAGGSASSESRHQLTFAYFLGEKTTFGQLWTWWMDEIEKRSNGTITFPRRFWDGTLLKGDQMLDGIRDGRADVAQITPPMYPGKFPLTSVTELPFASNNVPAGAAAIGRLAEENEALRKEWRQHGLVPLAWNIAAPNALGTKKEIRTMADLKGTKLRGIDRSSKVLKLAGANLFNLGPSDIYGAMERGLINGYFGIPFAFTGALKLPEVAKYHTDIGMGITTANAVVMSERTWEKLSKAQQDVIREVSAEIPAKLAEFDAVAEDASCEAVKQAGAKMSALPPAEVEKLRAIGERKLVDEWVKEVGPGAEEFRQAWLDAVKAEERNYADYELGMTRCRNALASGS